MDPSLTTLVQVSLSLTAFLWLKFWIVNVRGGGQKAKGGMRAPEDFHQSKNPKEEDIQAANKAIWIVKNDLNSMPLVFCVGWVAVINCFLAVPGQVPDVILGGFGLYTLGRLGLTVAVNASAPKGVIWAIDALSLLGEAVLVVAALLSGYQVNKVGGGSGAAFPLVIPIVLAVLWLKGTLIHVYLESLMATTGIGFQPWTRSYQAIEVTKEQEDLVDRLTRVTRNDLENIPNFAGIALGAQTAYLMASYTGGPNGGLTTVGSVLVIIFCVGRLSHTLCYLSKLSAPRSVSFFTGLLAQLTWSVVIVYGTFASAETTGVWRFYAQTASATTLVVLLKFTITNIFGAVLSGKAGKRAPEDKQNTTASAEDVEKFARARRVVDNDLENIPFFIAIVWLAFAGTLSFASTHPTALRPVAIAAIIFACSRVSHSVAYLRGLLFPRFLSFVLGSICIFTIFIASLVAAFGK